MRCLCVMILVLALSPRASAEPSDSEKDPATAVLLSAGTTLAGMVMIGTGNEGAMMLGAVAMYVGPSTGHWYAGEVGGRGLLTRLAAFGLVATGFRYAWATQGVDCLGIDDDAECSAAIDSAEREASIGAVLVYGGVGLWVTSTILDIARAPGAVRKWNDRNLTVAPTFVNGGAGISLGMKF